LCKHAQWTEQGTRGGWFVGHPRNCHVGQSLLVHCTSYQQLFSFLGGKDPAFNHWSKWVVRTQLITQDLRICPVLLPTSFTALASLRYIPRALLTKKRTRKLESVELMCRHVVPCGVRIHPKCSSSKQICTDSWQSWRKAVTILGSLGHGA